MQRQTATALEICNMRVKARGMVVRSVCHRTLMTFPLMLQVIEECDGLLLTLHSCCEFRRESLVIAMMNMNTCSAMYILSDKLSNLRLAYIVSLSCKTACLCRCRR